jgi:hypothetical protein
LEKGRPTSQVRLPQLTRSPTSQYWAALPEGPGRRKSGTSSGTFQARPMRISMRPRAGQRAPFSGAAEIGNSSLRLRLLTLPKGNPGRSRFATSRAPGSRWLVPSLRRQNRVATALRLESRRACPIGRDVVVPPRGVQFAKQAFRWNDVEGEAFAHTCLGMRRWTRTGGRGEGCRRNGKGSCGQDRRRRSAIESGPGRRKVQECSGKAKDSLRREIVS